MLFDHVCRKCLSPKLCRSSVRNPFEGMVSPFITFYRCRVCHQRQAKYWSVKIGAERASDKVSYAMRLRRL